MRKGKSANGKHEESCKCKGCNIKIDCGYDIRVKHLSKLKGMPETKNERILHNLMSNEHAIVITSFQDHTCNKKTKIITRHTSPERKYARRSIVPSQLTELDVQHVLEGGEHGLNRKNLIDLNKGKIRYSSDVGIIPISSFLVIM